MQVFSRRLWSKPDSGRDLRRSRKKRTKPNIRRRNISSSRLFYRDETYAAMRWAWRLPVLFLVAATGLYGLISGGHLSRAYQMALGSLDQAVRSAGFSIQEISVMGLNHVDRDAVLQVLGANGEGSILAFDARSAQSRVQRLPWVRRAKVMRLFPSTLVVDIEERKPLAVWQHESKHFLIDPQGTVITEVALLPDPALPLLVGAGAPNAAKSFLDLLNTHPGVSKKVLAAIRVAERRWTLQLLNGIEVWLPENGVATALDNLAKLDQSRRLLSRDVSVVDLRLPDRVTLRSRPGKRPGKDQKISRPAIHGKDLERGV